MASFKKADLLAKNRSPFQNGEEFLKEAFLSHADCLFYGLSNKGVIRDIV
jgi:hypothetical protein